MTASIAEVGSQHHGSVNWVNIHFATLFSVGVLMMILGGIGCRGVIHENPFLLGVVKRKTFFLIFHQKTFFLSHFIYFFFFEFDAQLFVLQFSCIALILSMMEIGMCVYISIHKNDFMKFVNDNFMDVYRVDAPAVQLMDYIQSTWKCCGKYGPLDWTLNIPPSCCKQPATKGCNTNLITAGAAAFFGVGYKSSIYTEVT